MSERLGARPRSATTHPPEPPEPPAGASRATLPTFCVSNWVGVSPACSLTQKRGREAEAGPGGKRREENGEGPEPKPGAFIESDLTEAADQ